MKIESRELRKRRASLISEMHDLCEKTSFGPEAQKRWKALDEEQKEVHRDIMRQETREEEERLQEVKTTAVHVEGRIYGDEWLRQAVPSHALPKQQGVADNTRMKPFLADLGSCEYRESFNSYCRFGLDGMNTAQRSQFTDLNGEIRTYTGLNTSTSGDAGGYTVPNWLSEGTGSQTESDFAIACQQPRPKHEHGQRARLADYGRYRPDWRVSSGTESCLAS
jgi:hypothetical protein